MFIPKATEKEFELHPPYTGPAVCVDVTTPKKVMTPYGEKEKFRIVFETGHSDSEGNPLCVWSSGFAPSLHEKAALHKFLKQWLGVANFDNGFDTESLIGRPAFVVIVHNASEDGKTTYANIASCTPLPPGTQPIKPTGKFKRQKDRPKSPADNFKKSDPTGAAAPEDPSKVFLDTKVHVGATSGTPLRDLSIEQIDRIIQHWLPVGKASPKPTADDKRLIAALEWILDERRRAAEEKLHAEPADDMPPF